MSEKSAGVARKLLRRCLLEEAQAQQAADPRPSNDRFASCSGGKQSDSSSVITHTKASAAAAASTSVSSTSRSVKATRPRTAADWNLQSTRRLRMQRHISE
ncbi:hypothetical protein MPSEU_000430600 [Mayamaea pseudoterrestris]|nr:hypothetical protein MPSEU_000430600 [Mayamaea pseudoterrestris]